MDPALIRSFGRRVRLGMVGGGSDSIIGGTHLFALRAEGITPVLAHPERNAEVQAHPNRLVELVDSGVLIQVTAASVDGRIGTRAEACGLRLVRDGLARERCPPRLGTRGRDGRGR